jgi:hypothetical protein
MIVNDYRPSLKAVGVSLIVVGVLDIGWMIWCVSHGERYSSSFNIFAVIAGILLVRGGLRTASVVAYFSAFLLSTFVGLLMALPFIMPLDLFLTCFTLHTASFVRNALFTGCVMAFIGWIYHRLTSHEVVAAIAEKYPRYTTFWRRPRCGFLVGAFLALILTVALGFMMHGARAERAIAEAKRKVGTGYRFCVTSLNMSSSRGSTRVGASVIAYSKDEIKRAEVGWEE